MRASCLERIAGQASIWTSVGTPTADRNQSAMTGWKHVSGIRLMLGCPRGRVKARDDGQGCATGSPDGKLRDIFSDPKRTIELRTRAGRRKRRPIQFDDCGIVLICTIDGAITVRSHRISRNILPDDQRGVQPERTGETE